MNRYRPAFEIFRTGVRTGPRLFAFSCVLMLIQAALPPALILATGTVVGQIPGTLRAGFGSPAGRLLVAALAAAGIIIVVQQALTQIVGELAMELARRTDHDFHQRAMRAVLAPAGIAHLEDATVADRIARVRGLGSEWMTPGGAFRGYLGMTTSRLSATASLVLVAAFRWWLAAGLLVLAVVIRPVALRNIWRTASIFMEHTPDLRRSSYIRDLVLTPPAAKEWRLFAAAPWLLARFRIHWMAALEEVWRRRRGGRFERGAISVLFGLVAAVCYGVVAHAAATGDIGLREVAVLVQAVGIVAQMQAYSHDHDWDMQYGKAAIPALLELERDFGQKPAPATERVPAAGMPRTSLRFEGVRFRYPATTRDVFADLELEIPAGTSMAIVGPNGAGKTTLIKLLAGLYEPDGGRIAVDGTDLRDLDMSSWRERLGVIFQDFVRYDMTAAENVGLAHASDREAVAESARRAGIAGVVEALPNGWDTLLSRQYEGGADLSGGQWQRLALARALFAVRGGAGVLVLDEPTANLDVRAEAELYDRFLDLTRGLTTLVISHRFSTVRRAERICVVRHGRVWELGTHDELMERDGTYAHMFRLQARRFAEDATA